MKKAILILIIINSYSILRATNFENSIVKIYSAKQEFDYNEPWKRGKVKNGSATGFIIEGGRILTNAHAVSNSKYIQVRFNNTQERIPVSLEFISDDYDLAILKFNDDFKTNNLVPLKFGNLPKVREKVSVYGYPLGGDRLSITQGIISRIQQYKYVHSQQNYTVLQTDAAINSGNSGGPVIIDGLVIGVAFQGIKKADNIGYIIPVHIINHFIKDIKDGSYEGIPSLGLRWSKMESKIHRRMLGMKPNQSGVLVNNILPNSSLPGLFRIDDVLLSVNNYEIGVNGSIEFRVGERIGYEYILENLNFGDEVSIRFLRNKKVFEKKVIIKKPIKESIVTPFKSSESPMYYITSGFIFEKLSVNYLNKYRKSFFTIKNTPYQLLSYVEKPPLDVEEIIFIVSVLPDESNMGYQEIKNLRIERINGKKVINFNSFVVEIKNGGFIVLESTEGQKIVIDGDFAKERDKVIMENYNISKQSSQKNW